MIGAPTIRARVIGIGACLPSNIVTNDDLAKRF
jgi:3-oxoacyl-[acyl-carrier-protein] synthase III